MSSHGDPSLTVHSQVNLPVGPGPEGYPAVIAKWREAWAALRTHTNRDISEINSIHVVNHHLEDHYVINGESLVKVSDHVVEHAHQWLRKVMAKGNYVVKDVTSDAHGDKLFRAVMHNNTYAMDAMRLRPVTEPPIPAAAPPLPPPLPLPAVPYDGLHPPLSPPPPPTP